MKKEEIDNMVAEKLYYTSPEEAVKLIRKMFKKTDDQILAGIIFGMYYMMM